MIYWTDFFIKTYFLSFYFHLHNSNSNSFIYFFFFVKYYVKNRKLKINNVSIFQYRLKCTDREVNHHSIINTYSYMYSGFSYIVKYFKTISPLKCFMANFRQFFFCFQVRYIVFRPLIYIVYSNSNFDFTPFKI